MMISDSGLLGHPAP